MKTNNRDMQSLVGYRNWQKQEVKKYLFAPKWWLNTRKELFINTLLKLIEKYYKQYSNE